MEIIKIKKIRYRKKQKQDRKEDTKRFMFGNDI
jgi:hypothetical protein